jgi:hypothetical protein
LKSSDYLFCSFAMAWTQESALELVLLYETHECLWNIREKAYHDRTV